MSLVYQRIRISNAALPDVEEVDARAAVDSGANDLCIPALVARQLRLKKLEDRTVTYADGRRETVDYVGPVIVEVFGRKAFGGAMVIGDQVLLGAIPMEAMDVLVDPQRQRLIANPDHPNTPGAMAMGMRTSHP